MVLYFYTKPIFYETIEKRSVLAPK